MTREEAIHEIEKVFEPAFANYIITALTEGATSSDKEQQTCEDCISREQAVYVASGYCAPQNIADELRKLPPVQPQRNPGHWLWELASNGWANHICSECGFKENTDIHVKLNWKFCPKCGAEMEVKE